MTITRVSIIQRWNNCMLTNKQPHWLEHPKATVSAQLDTGICIFESLRVFKSNVPSVLSSCEYWKVTHSARKAISSTGIRRILLSPQHWEQGPALCLQVRTSLHRCEEKKLQLPGTCPELPWTRPGQLPGTWPASCLGNVLSYHGHILRTSRDLTWVTLDMSWELPGTWPESCLGHVLSFHGHVLITS